MGNPVTQESIFREFREIICIQEKHQRCTNQAQLQHSYDPTVGIRIGDAAVPGPPNDDHDWSNEFPGVQESMDDFMDEDNDNPFDTPPNEDSIDERSADKAPEGDDNPLGLSDKKLRARDETWTSAEQLIDFKYKKTTSSKNKVKIIRVTVTGAFTATKSYHGKEPGYSFGTRELGTGYYADSAEPKHRRYYVWRMFASLHPSLTPLCQEPSGTRGGRTLMAQGTAEEGSSLGKPR